MDANASVYALAQNLVAGLDAAITDKVSTWPVDEDWPAWTAGLAQLPSGNKVLHIEVFDLSLPGGVAFDTQGPMPVEAIIRQLADVVGVQTLIRLAILSTVAP